MNYIEFKTTAENNVICTYKYNNKVSTLSKKDAEKIFRLLEESGLKAECLHQNVENILRYYNVDKFIKNEIVFKKNNTGKRVQRTNKFAPIAATVGSALMIALILHSCTNQSNIQEKSSSEKEIPPLVMAEETESQKKKTIIDDEFFIPDYNFDFKYEDRSQTDKAISAKSKYYEIIEKHCSTYGLPTNLMVAIATQEKGEHSNQIESDGGFGLFQIQAQGSWNWVGKEITAYNFDSGQYETITVCQDKNNCLDTNMLAWLDYNVKVACMIMAYDLELCNNDVILALQTYNSGTGTIELKNKYGEDWINHRSNLPGDPSYIEHVLSYIPQEENLLVYTDSNNNIHKVEVNNINYNNLSK